MDEVAEPDTDSKPGSHSIHTRLRKHFQKTRPSLGSKIAPDQKGDPQKGTAGKASWKNKRQVLDRVFSSSQPNLCCSGPGVTAAASRELRDSPSGLKLLSESKQVTPVRQRALFASVWSAVTHQKRPALGTNKCPKLPPPAQHQETCTQSQAADTVSITVASDSSGLFDFVFVLAQCYCYHMYCICSLFLYLLPISVRFPHCVGCGVNFPHNCKLCPDNPPIASLTKSLGFFQRWRPPSGIRGCKLCGWNRDLAPWAFNTDRVDGCVLFATVKPIESSEQ